MLDAVKVKLRKRDSSGGGNIAGAKFRIYTEAEYQKGEAGVPINLDDYKGFLDLSQMRIDETDHTLLISDSSGRFYTGYLPEGTYYLVEVEAPAKYIVSSEAVVVKVNDNGMQYRYETETGWHARKADSNGYYNLYINNTQGYKLPETGGPGDRIFYVGGTSLILMGGILLYRRMRSEVMRR